MSEFKAQDKLLAVNPRSGGCAAKIPAAQLQEILAKIPQTKSDVLIAGYEHFDDAAVYKISDDLAFVQTVDFFPPLVEDPFLFGKIAATNALSDIYAMGAKPVLALNILSFPTCDYPLDVAQAILSGGMEQVAKSGAILAGGHSIQAREVLYGLAVTGLIHPKGVLTNDGAKFGDKIILTKAIGTGVALLGLKAQLLLPQTSQVLFDGLTTLNDGPLAIFSKFAVHAVTDVTGFGLIGHLHSMAKASGLAGRLFLSQLPVLPQAVELASQGIVPAAAYDNRNAFSHNVKCDSDADLSLRHSALMDLCYDPQTAGGLLLAVAAKDAASCLASLRPMCPDAAMIGEFETGIAGHLEFKE